MSYQAIPNLCDTLRRLALQAGAEIMMVYQSGDFAARSKSDNSPVTAADEAADRVISAGLRMSYPDIPVVTEEQANTHEINAVRFFIVDPLDGTKEFINRRGDFTVNIALIDDGVPVAGVVYAPARQRLFYADHTGAYEETGPFGDEIGPTQSIHVASPLADGLRIVASKSHRDAATDAYIAQYNPAEFKSAGSSLKLCLVATGEADFYPRLGPTMEWDTAAGDAILRAAGGVMVDLHDLTVLTYGKAAYRNPFFAAYAPGVDVINVKKAT